MNSVFVKFCNSLIHSEGSTFWVSFFRKAIFGFLLLKIFLIWPVLEDVIFYMPFKLDSFFKELAYAPLLLIHLHKDSFVISFVILLIVGIAFRYSYVASFLIFWFSFCLSKLTLPISNGVDSILNLFLFLIIFMEVPKNNTFFIDSGALEIISKTARVVAQLHLALIYFLSGFDKLLSEAWRSGAAIYSITHLTFFQNPNLILELNRTACLLLGWSIILFEIGFALLIWFKRLRPTLLVLGCIFHVSIILFLGLLDFGLIMIISYCLFLPIQNPRRKVFHQFSNSV